MKKTVFADPLLPFGTFREADTHCTHLQIAQADTQTKICKRVQFLPPRSPKAPKPIITALGGRLPLKDIGTSSAAVGLFLQAVPAVG